MRPGQQFDKGDHRANNPYFTDQNISRTNAFLENIRPLAEVKGGSLAQLALKWTLEQPGITAVLTGARNESQSVQNAAAVEFKLNHGQINFINLELEKMSEKK